MDLLSSNSMLLMEKAMGFLWTRQAAYLDNITNADTPNYKPKVVSFEDSLREQLELAMAPAQDGKRVEQSVRQVLDQSDLTALEVQEIQEATRMDDNGVNVTEQMVEMIRNSYQQQYLYGAINKSYSILRMAVRGQ